VKEADNLNRTVFCDEATFLISAIVSNYRVRLYSSLRNLRIGAVGVLWVVTKTGVIGPFLFSKRVLDLFSRTL
jgi:hypothetical protein